MKTRLNKTVRGLSTLMLVIGLLFGGLVVVGCGGDDDGAEEVGEKIDDAVEEAGDEVEEATD